MKIHNKHTSDYFFHLHDTQDIYSSIIGSTEREVRPQKWLKNKRGKQNGTKQNQI